MLFKYHILPPYSPIKETQNIFQSNRRSSDNHKNGLTQPLTLCTISRLIIETISRLLPAAVIMMSNRHKHRRDLWKYVLLLPAALYKFTFRVIVSSSFEKGRIICFKYNEVLCVHFRKRNSNFRLNIYKKSLSILGSLSVGNWLFTIHYNCPISGLSSFLFLSMLKWCA